MITEQQMFDAATETVSKSTRGAGYIAGFIDGAAWMQEQDQWISVEDRLPELDDNLSRKAGGFSARVIVLIEAQEHFATYSYSLDDWICHTYYGDCAPTRWTHIPKRPKQLAQ